MGSNNHQIAKNALFLYARMFLLMLIGLYTSRVNLQSLGIENYGVYNVVAGFVVMFSALTGALGNAISRFIQVELGKGDKDRLRVVFSTSVTIQIFIGILIIILAEIIGIWFINNKMQIPEGSSTAAIWVLQFSLASFVLNLLYVPYYSCIIAHEKMSAFAYISLVEAVMKLVVAFSVAYSPVNKLIVFAILIMATSFITRSLYIRYCRRHFEECVYQWTIDKPLVKEMSSFVGWNLFSQGASVLSVQGVNMVMNVFFGVVVNAARAIETQVNTVVQQFISNFTTALIPPITKSYAAGDKESAYELVYKGDRYAYYLMLLITLPILFEANQLLTLWLKTPPDYTTVFVQWTLLASLAKVLGGNTIFALIMADGNIKNFQIAIAIVGLLPLPLAWFSFYVGGSVVTAYIIYFVVHFLLIFVRLYYANRITGLPVKAYFFRVLLPVFVVTIIAVVAPLMITNLMSDSILRFVLNVVLTIILTSLTILFVGMKTAERKTIIAGALSFVRKR